MQSRRLEFWHDGRTCRPIEKNPANRRADRALVYLDPCLKDILEETYGVIVYQEQATPENGLGRSLGREQDGKTAQNTEKPVSPIS